jgi:hypothetical protein
VAINKYPQQIYQKEEGETYYRCCWYFFHTPLFVMLALSIIWPFMSDAWLTSDFIQTIDIWFRGHFTKLAAEGAAYDRMEPLWGTSYVSFVGICWSFVVVTVTLQFIPLIYLTLKFGHPVTYDQRNSAWKIPLAFVLIGILMFGQWMNLDSPDPGRTAIVWTRSWFVFSLAAVVAGLLHVSCADLIVYVTKVLKHRNK